MLAIERSNSLALKPREDATRSPKQGYQWLHKRIFSSIFFYNRVVNITKTVELQSLLNRYGEVAIYKSLTQGGPFIMSQFLCSIPTGMGQLSSHVENMTAA